MIEVIRSWISDIYFSEPLYFSLFNLSWIVLPLFLLILFLKLRNRPPRSRGSRYRLIGGDSTWLCVILILIASIIALAGPRSEGAFVVGQAGSIDVMILFDNSASMRSIELGRSRHDIAIKAISNFLDSKIMRPGDRITLVIFGQISIWKMPFSEDLEDFRAKLARLNQPDVYQDEFQMITNLSGALEYISECVGKDISFKNIARSYGVSWSTNDHIAFVLSDGDDQGDANFNEAIRDLNSRKMRVYPIAIGGPGKSKLTVKVFNADDPKSKPQEIIIETTLETRGLSRVAAQTGGDIFILDALDKSSLSFMKDAIAKNRSTVPRLVRSPDKGRDIWWEILTPVSILSILLAIKLS